MAEAEVLIVGAGLAGLCCARRLAQTRTPCRILEASDGVGGRVRTDLVDGFRLDRGFQIFLTAYPEAQRVLDYGPLDLRRFYAGALVRYRGRFHRLAHPFKHPLALVASAVNPIGGLRDKLRVGLLREKLCRGSLAALHARPERLTLDALRWEGGFGTEMIDRLFRPFLGGVFFDRSLATSSRAFRFVFRMFAQGSAVVPAAGMQAIPEQIAAGLPAGCVRLNAPVERVEPGRDVLRSGETLTGRAVVVATEGPAAARLLGDVTMAPMRGVTCLYFAAPAPVLGEPILVLDGDGTGPVNNLVELSAAAPSYAPPGQHLISASVLGTSDTDDQTLAKQVREQLVEWFGGQVHTWRHLRTYRIPHGLPDMTAPALDPWQRPVKLRDGLFVCGDHRDNGSIDGAMTSGFRAAQAVLGA